MRVGGHGKAPTYLLCLSVMVHKPRWEMKAPIL